MTREFIRQTADQIFIDRPVYQAGPASRGYRLDCDAYFKREVEKIDPKIASGVLKILDAMMDGATFLQLDDMAWKITEANER